MPILKLKDLQFVAAQHTPFEPLPYIHERYPIIVFGGYSNVGKSSLINALVGKTIAKTAKNPGKTKTINTYHREGAKVVVVDLPGYGFAKIAKTEKALWAKMVEEFFEKVKSPKLVVNVCDARRGTRDLDQELEDYVMSLKLHFVRVFNKADALNQKERHALKGEMLLSAKERKLSPLEAVIEAFLENL